jgi:hypothetical protein
MQVVVFLRERILTGTSARYVPSTAFLIREFGCGKYAVERTFAVLRDDGFIGTIPNWQSKILVRPYLMSIELIRFSSGWNGAGRSILSSPADSQPWPCRSTTLVLVAQPVPGRCRRSGGVIREGLRVRTAARMARPGVIFRSGIGLIFINRE